MKQLILWSSEREWLCLTIFYLILAVRTTSRRTKLSSKIEPSLRPSTEIFSNSKANLSISRRSIQRNCKGRCHSDWWRAFHPYSVIFATSFHWVSYQLWGSVKTSWYYFQVRFVPPYPEDCFHCFIFRTCGLHVFACVRSSLATVLIAFSEFIIESKNIIP